MLGSMFTLGKTRIVVETDGVLRIQPEAGGILKIGAPTLDGVPQGWAIE